jgi:uncharacterized protein with NAD-binding domain and iron-sulfur cluster
MVSLEFRLPGVRTIPYPYTPLPKPIHLASSILRFGGMTWRERFKLVSWLEQIWEGAIERPSDLAHRSADEWLASLGQSHHTRRTIWDPFAQWLTGAPLTTLPSDVFWTTVEPLFCRSPHASRWAIAPSMHASLVQPMMDRLAMRGATVLRDTAAMQLLGEGDQVTGVVLQNGSVMRGDWYLSAVPHRRLASLLPERWLSRYAYFQQLSELTDVPMMHLRATIRQSCVQPRIVLVSEDPFYALVLHSDGPQDTVCNFYGRNPVTDRAHSRTQPQSQAEAVLRSLHLLSSDAKVDTFDKQDHDILSLEIGMQLRRPVQRSPLANLLVAGAWTDTGWPPNVESAVVSANRCVEIVTCSQP